VLCRSLRKIIRKGLRVPGNNILRYLLYLEEANFNTMPISAPNMHRWEGLKSNMPSLIRHSNGLIIQARMYGKRV
jgi:hypothetical protein